MKKHLFFKIIVCILISFLVCCGIKHRSTSKFRVVAFYTAINEGETAHLSFVHEANRWFTRMADKYNFIYDSTFNWHYLNSTFLASYQVVIFLDARPDSPEQRVAFREYIEKGGSWMGFHFAGFALTPSAFPQNWDWYHNQFLGSGEYNGNTWRPTSAVLRIEDPEHPATRNLPKTITAAPNEWYSWKNDLRTNPDIKILLSIDSTSFPLGTGPKLYEIWHSGYYPVVWTNKKYKMIYFNMGHNDLDSTGKAISQTFGNKYQDRLILETLFWLGKAAKN